MASNHIHYHTCLQQLVMMNVNECKCNTLKINIQVVGILKGRSFVYGGHPRRNGSGVNHGLTDLQFV